MTRIENLTCESQGKGIAMCHVLREMKIKNCPQNYAPKENTVLEKGKSQC